MSDTIRQAEIRSTGIGGDVYRVEAFLPLNYSARALNADVVEITGRDAAGHTLDGYVIPRLASGGMYADEISGRVGSDDTAESL